MDELCPKMIGLATEKKQEQDRFLKKKRRNNLTHVEQERTHKKAAAKSSGNQCRFFSMMFLTGGFMIVEFVVGIVTGSLALIGDACHMLSDLGALIVGYYAAKSQGKASSPLATFGYVRAEVVGAIINASALLALCFMIVLEAVERMIHMEDELKNPWMVFIVGSIGLGVNIVGLFIFGHGHGHGHSHGGHGHSHGAPKKKKHGHSHGHDHGHSHDHGQELGSQEHLTDHCDEEDEDAMDMNIRGVFLHVLGDALGSVAVIISAIIVIYTPSGLDEDGEEHSRLAAQLADPLCSLVIAAIIIFATIPLMKQAIPILLQKTPTQIDLKALSDELSGVKGVVEVHELHCWSLTPDKCIGNCHALLDKTVKESAFIHMLDEMKRIFHKFGVHSSAIQPEFTYHLLDEGARGCYDIVCDDKACMMKTCCGSTPTATTSPPTEPELGEPVGEGAQEV